MKAIEICAGPGGMTLGLQRAGFEVLGVERDRETCLFHRSHVGPCELADVHGWHPSDEVDLVAGGVSCQSFSQQGRRLGARETIGPLFPDVAEPRSRLYLELLRVAGEAKARAVLLENVPGLRGETRAAVVEAFEAAGFRADWAILDAADFGVPQHRQRLFIVGFRRAADARRFAWPLPSHGPARIPWVTMRDALGLRGGRGPMDEVLEDLLEGAGLLDRPSTTISATAGGRVARPGHKTAGDQWRGSVRLSESDCAALQGFPEGLPWARGGRGYRMIGNAAPPALVHVIGLGVARALVRSAAARTLPLEFAQAEGHR